jgi:hypothetical protein
MALSFEWDEEKARDNEAKHGVSFELARRVFRDAFAIELIDDREAYGEDRLILIGAVEGALLFVAFTEREDRIRLISARRATENEQDHYYEENN